MKLSPIAASLTIVILAAAGYAQQTLAFDFETAGGLADLQQAGWNLIDDQTTYTGTIAIETLTVHGGTKALRLGMRDVAYFPVNGQFGTLELWIYDHGYKIQDLIASADGPRFGLSKSMDVDTSFHYPANEPVDHGILRRSFGTGAGLVQRGFLGSDAGYGVEWGVTTHQDIAVIGSATADYTAPARNAGWAGDQSWFTPSWFGYLGAAGRVEGWYHWRVAYTAPGVVEISLLEAPAGVIARTATGTPANAFSGTEPGGVEAICLYGGRTMIAGAEPEQWFGDGIYDDITWTPTGGPVCNPGDADGDGDVDLDDFVVLKNNFGTATGATCAEGDFDADGDVDLDDFVLLKNNFGVQY
ncbi:MAG: hypothetical protein GX591_07175 [Planctomycetes bacterium]|nr:hypothetical protein [Planctomycetota bacterium]